MRLSKREKVMLILLGFFLIGVVYYQFVFTKQVSKLSSLRDERQQLQDSYDKMQASVISVDKNNTAIKIYKDSIESKSMEFYPQIYQDKIILEINDLLEKAKIKGSLSFSEVEVLPVNKYFPDSNSDTQVPALKEPADEINSLEKQNNGASDKNTGESTVDSVDNDGLLVEQMQVTVNFTGTYEDVSEFIKLVSEYARLIAVPNIALTSSGDNKVSGTLNLEFYSVPKVSDEDAEYLQWTIDNTYGKSNPFKSDSSISTVTTDEKNKDYNLIMSVNGKSSDLPSMSFGKEGDFTRNTYIYYDKNEKIDVDLEINEEDGKYYVKYKTSTSSYPADYNDKGALITPIDGKINIVIYSSTRTGTDDNVSVNLNAKSNLDNVSTKITILNEDKSNPRVIVNAVGKVEYFVK